MIPCPPLADYLVNTILNLWLFPDIGTIPSISSNFGTAQYIVKDGNNGFLVDTKQEWIDKISLLVNDEELRRKMGNNARKHIESNYSVRAVESLYLDSISDSEKWYQKVKIADYVVLKLRK